MNKKREQFQILRDLLLLVNPKMSKTKLLSKANLSTPMFLNFINLAIKNNFLKEVAIKFDSGKHPHHRFQVTKEGTEFISLANKLEDSLGEFYK